MANPKRRHTRSRRDSRRANWRIILPSIARCPQCGAPKLPHRVCPQCGFYRGERIINIPEKEEKEKATKTKGSGT